MTEINWLTELRVRVRVREGRGHRDGVERTHSRHRASPARGDLAPPLVVVQAAWAIQLLVRQLLPRWREVTAASGEVKLVRDEGGEGPDKDALRMRHSIWKARSTASPRVSSLLNKQLIVVTFGRFCILQGRLPLLGAIGQQEG